MDGTSMTPEKEKLNALRKVIPEAFSEGKIDWEKLRATLGEDINFANERYVLNWAGKSDAFKALQIPTTKTLIPAKDESVNFDKTEHIFIEGENLEVLKVLQKSYFGKVKMIYIDPPYNTGNDSFIYPDKFSESKADYEKRVGDKDEEGYMTKDGMFRKNSKENGQYHSNWLSMMMPRLYLAKNLLRQDGVIFISIDDNEVHNLRLLMNEIFGEENFVGCISWLKKRKGSFLSKKLISITEYCLVFGKTENIILFGGKPNFSESQPIIKRTNSIGSLKFPSKLVKTKLKDGRYKRGNYGKGTNSIKLLNDIKVKKGMICTEFELEGPFTWGQENLNNEIKSGASVIINTINFQVRVFKSENPDSFKGLLSLINGVEISGTNEDGYEQLRDLLGGEKIMDYPKPVNYLKTFINAQTYFDPNATILDFFAGSGTTTHAVMALNAEDGGNRKCISVQLPELCDEKSEARKAGYKTIADIAKERIRLAGKKIQDEIHAEIKTTESTIKKLQSKLPSEEIEAEIENLKVKTAQLQHQDLGFKVFKLSDSNFKQWRQIEGKGAKDTRAERAKVLAKQMKMSIDPVAENATTENMVYELLLKNGEDLNSTLKQSHGCVDINSGELMLLLEQVNQEIIDKVIASQPTKVIASQPTKVIALDKLFKGNDRLKTNIVLQMKDAGIEFKTI